MTAGIILMNSLGAIIPLIIFGTVSLVCLIVATLGTDRAVAKNMGKSIKNRKREKRGSFQRLPINGANKFSKPGESLKTFQKFNLTCI